MPVDVNPGNVRLQEYRREQACVPCDTGRNSPLPVLPDYKAFPVLSAERPDIPAPIIIIFSAILIPSLIAELQII